MPDRRSRPDDPAVIEAVIERFRDTSREELLQELRSRPDFDESWIRSAFGTKGNGKAFRTVKVHSRRTMLPRS